jgi:hypothetical protein
VEEVFVTDYILFGFYELRTIKRDTLGELVQCKPSKIYSTTKIHVRLDISAP